MERPWTIDQQADAKATVQPLTFEDLFADEHERLYRASISSSGTATRPRN